MMLISSIVVQSVLFLIWFFSGFNGFLLLPPLPMASLYMAAFADALLGDCIIFFYILIALSIILPLLLGFLFLKPCKFKTVSNVILLTHILSDIIICCIKITEFPLVHIIGIILDLIFMAMIIVLMRLDKKVIKEKQIQKLQTES